MMKQVAMMVLLCTGLGMWAGCGGVDPDVRRGDMFFKNQKYAEAALAYERAFKRAPKLFDEPQLRDRFKNSYYYNGGQLEMGGSLEAALKYYEKGFALVPTDAGMCDKLAKYYWGKEEFAKASQYFEHLVDIDSKAPDTDNKWRVMGEDFYAYGYSLYKNGKIQESLDPLKQSLKISPKGKYAAKAKSALEAAKVELKKKQ